MSVAPCTTQPLGTVSCQLSRGCTRVLVHAVPSVTWLQESCKPLHIQHSNAHTHHTHPHFAPALLPLTPPLPPSLPTQGRGEEQYTLGRYDPVLLDVMEEAVGGKLSPDEYPYVRSVRKGGGLWVAAAVFGDVGRHVV